jgi:RNA polymerase sigma-70 factor (ECF subfamily)
MPHAEDRDLLRSARRGDRAAAERLAERLACVPAMLRIRERRMGVALSSDERAEIVQETVAALWSKLGHYTGHRPLEAWIWGFAVRQHLKAIDQKRRSLHAEPREPEVVDPGPLEDAGWWERVRAMVERLGPPDSRILQLRHFEETSFEGIGLELGMPTNTVKTRYYRALARLRVLLQPLWREVMG